MKGRAVLASVGLCAVTCAVFCSAAAAETSPPPTLTGESFHQDAPTTTSVTCNHTELGGTFEASGIATGPYPGTFQETGSALVTTNGSGHAISYDLTASFTIDSPVGQVAGTKHSTNFGVSCADSQTASLAFNTTPGAFVATDTYQAKILTASGAFADKGLFQVTYSPSFLGGFTELFSSALPAPRQLLPTSTADCKHDGWRNFGGMFKNQGQCVSFVERGPKKVGA